MKFQFSCLIYNQSLSGSDYVKICEPYLSQVLTRDFNLPIIDNKPFILSCFALSVDGRLCYQDLQSGFAIAKNNFIASETERFADWWLLSLARSISDAVIIGSNSIIQENGEYCANLDIPELQQIRSRLAKPDGLLHIVVLRDANKIDWCNELIFNNKNIRLLIYCEEVPNNICDELPIVNSFQPNLERQIIKTNKIDIASLLTELYHNGMRTILNESPYYHHELQRLHLLDEAWINTSGVYIGGGSPVLGALNSGFLSSSHPHYSILSLHNIGTNFLYTRYRITY